MENVNRCDNCSFSRWIVGVDRPVLVCKEKSGYVGWYRSLYLDSSCANFYPSETFKKAAKAPRPIPLTQGKFALVAADDYYHLAQFRWFAMFSSKTFYAVRSLPMRKKIKMHRQIMAAPSHLVVDHIDHDGLNNCRSNLRLCTPAQNIRNVPLRDYGTSKYKGVSWYRSGKKWIAVIQSNNKRHHLGYFTDEIAAAIAYDEQAKVLHGQFACLNFPTPAETASTQGTSLRGFPRPDRQGGDNIISTAEGPDSTFFLNIRI